MRVEVAIGADCAAIAERARLADATAVEDQSVGRSRPGRRGHCRAQLLLDDLRVIRLRNPDPVRHTQDVAVDGKPGNAERVSEHDIGGLPPTPGSLTSASIVRGTSPPWLSTTSVAMPTSDRDLA